MRKKKLDIILLMINMKKPFVLIALSLLGVGAILVLITRALFTTTPSPTSQQLFSTPTPFPTAAIRPNLVKPSIAPVTPNISVKSVTLSADLSALPTSASIYKISSYSLPVSTTESIANKLGVTKKDTIQTLQDTITIWESSDSVKQLTSNATLGYLSYLNDYAAPKGIGIKVKTPDDSVKIAKEFLNKLDLLASDLQVNTPSIFFTTADGGHIEEVSFDQATFIGIPFKRVLNSLTVYNQQENTDQIVILVDKYGTVRKMSFHYAFIREVEMVQLPSPSAITARILKGEATVVKTTEETFSLSEITTLNISSVEIGYLDDRTTSFLQPVYILKGLADSPESKTQQVSLYMPVL